MQQHFVPKVLLSNFVDRQTKQNRGLWLWFKSSGRWERRALGAVASLSNFYSDVLPGGELDDTGEKYMQRLESMIMPTLRYHIEARRRISPPIPDNAFVTFVATLIAETHIEYET